jgi:hypothetical protein
MNFKCIRCGHETKLKGDMKKHINRKKICKPLLSNIIPLENKSTILSQIDVGFFCKHCNKKYSRKDNLKRHMDNCSTRVDNTLKVMENTIKTLQEQVEMFTNQNKYTEINDELNSKDNQIEKLTNKIENMKVLANVPKNRIRQQARKKYISSNLPLKCLNCNFDQHIHVDHIKQIQNFGNGDKIVDINDITNLCALCPNCHYGKDTLKDPKILRKVLIHSVLVRKIINK